MSDPNAQHHQDKFNIEMMWHRFAELRETTIDDEHHIPPALYYWLDRTLANVCNANDVQVRNEDDYSTLVMYGDLMFHFGQFAAMNGLYRCNLEPCGCLEVTDEQIKAFFDGVNFGKGNKDA